MPPPPRSSATTLTDTVTNTVTVTWSSGVATIDENAGELVLTATITPAAPSGVILSFATESSTATAPADYAARRSRLAIPAGQTAFTVPVTLVDDALVEGNEQFSVTLSSSQPTVTMGLSETVVTIVDDDHAYLSVGDASGNEADGSLTFLVTQSVTSTLETQVAYHTVDDTATAADDYRAVTGTLSLPPGSTAVTVSVAVTDDLMVEPEETFTLVLENPIQRAVDARGRGGAYPQ